MTRALGIILATAGLAMVFVAALAMLAEGTAADLERRGAAMTVLHWPLLFAGFATIAVGVVVLGRHFARKG